MKPILRKLFFAVFLCVPAFCGARGATCAPERDVGGQALDETTWRRLNAIYEEVAEEHYREARAGLEKMMERAGRDPYLRAILNQALGQVEWAGRNYPAALAYIETAIELDALPDPSHFALIYQLAQLYYLQGRHDDALERLDTWFCQAREGQITAAAYVLEASIHAQKGDFPSVLEAIDRAISLDDDPAESWYRLKLAAHYELEQYRVAAGTLETMISRWPDDRTYWLQLSRTWYRLQEDDRALAVLSLAYRGGLLETEGDYVFLSSLYSHSGIPFRAAQVLEDGIDRGVVVASERNWTLLADTWYRADEPERSLAAFEAAGGASLDGVIDLRRAFILVELERWPEALAALDRSLEKGGLDERQNGEAYLLRGMSRFHLSRLEAAGEDWIRAAGFEQTRESARQWINHLNETRRRAASS